MNTPPEEVLPRFAVVDRRVDGPLRILAEFVDEAAARRYVQGLRGAGCAAYLVVLTAVQDVIRESQSMEMIK